MTKYKAIVPDAITWEFDEIVAGGQNDRYAMTITLAPYGTLINDPKLSKTAGKWAWAVAPGAHGRDESRVSVGGWTFGVPTPGHPVWDTLEVQMRSAISQVQLGQKTAKVALDELATDWQRSLRRAGIGRG